MVLLVIAVIFLGLALAGIFFWKKKKKRNMKVLGYVCSGILILPLILFILIPRILRYIDEIAEIPTRFRFHVRHTA